MIAQAKRRFHEFIDLFPAMEQADREQLKQDIREHGVQTPVVIYNGQIADGRHRVEIAEELGINYPTIEFDGTEHELLLHLMTLNFHRRHLTQGQKAAVVAHYQLLARGMGADDRKPGRRPAGESPRGKDSNGKQRRELEEVAKSAGVGKTSLWQAETVGKKRPDLLKEVIDGKTSLRAAHEDVVNPQPKTTEPKPSEQENNEPLPLESETEESEDECYDTADSAEAEHEEEASPPEQRDCLGHLLPPDLVPVFADLELATDLEKQAKALLKGVREFAETSAGVFVDKPAIFGELKNVVKELRAKRPYTLCPNCEGEGCHQCEHNGWMGESRFLLMTTNERQAWIERGKADLAGCDDRGEF